MSMGREEDEEEEDDRGELVDAYRTDNEIVIGSARSGVE